MPDRFGSWETVYRRFRLGTRKGRWQKILLHVQVQRQADDAIDGSGVRAPKAAAGA